MRAVLMSLSFLATSLLVGGALVGQEPKPGDKKADTKVGKDEPKAKQKGQLPQYWGQLSLTEDQKQKVYSIQNKHNEEIDKLEAQIKSLKEKIAKERLEVLTPDQKKRLEELLKSKAGG